MRLSRYTDIGLRALMYLGAHPERSVPSGEMASRLNVSRDHLMKSLQHLDALGLVSSTRGRNGGFSMVRPNRRPPELAKLGSLVRALEPSLALAECFAPGSACPLTGDCRLAGALAQARDAFFDALDTYSLTDLITRDRSVLVQLGSAS